MTPAQAHKRGYTANHTRIITELGRHGDKWRVEASEPTADTGWRVLFASMSVNECCQWVRVLRSI